MRRAITQHPHSKLITTVLSLSPQGCSLGQLAFHGGLQFMVRIPGEALQPQADEGGISVVSPAVLKMCRALLSSWSLTITVHGASWGSRTVSGYLEGVLSLCSDYRVQPWLEFLTQVLLHV